MGFTYHKDLTGDDLHNPKSHASSHIGGTDDITSLLGVSVSSQVITLTNFAITPSSAPTLDYQIANKKYVDDAVAGLVSIHNSLSGLQGGTTGEYYHLTSTQHTNLTSFLDASPTNPETKYLNGNFEWVAVAVGAGGFAGNLYFSTVDSDVSGYKKFDYSNLSPETELTVTISNTEVLARTYLYDYGLATEVLDAGLWVANYRVKVSGTQGETQIKFEAFLYHQDTTETTLFSSYSPILENTTYETIRSDSNQTYFSTATTDRLGVRIYFKTTASNNITINTIVGGEHASYFTTPLRIRHNQLREWNQDPDYQHIDATDRTNLDNLSGINTGDQSLDGLTDVMVSSNLSNNDIVIYDSGDAIWRNINYTTLTDASYLRLDGTNSDNTVGDFEFFKNNTYGTGIDGDSLFIYRNSDYFNFYIDSDEIAQFISSKPLNIYTVTGLITTSAAGSSNSFSVGNSSIPVYQNPELLVYGHTSSGTKYAKLQVIDSHFKLTREDSGISDIQVYFPQYIETIGDLESLWIKGTGNANSPIFNIEGLGSTSVNNGKALQSKTTGDSYGRFMLYTDGKMGWGSGSGARDVFLRRSTSNTLEISSNAAGDSAGNLALPGRIASNLRGDSYSPYRNLQQFSFNMHPEDDHAIVIPYFMNEIAFNLLRGGSVTFTPSDSGVYPDDNLFDGSANYVQWINPTGSIVIEVTFHKVLNYGLIVGFSGVAWARGRTVTIETYRLSTSSWNTDYTTTNNPGQITYRLSGTDSSGINKLRLTFSDFAYSGAFRLSEIFAISFASSLGADYFLTKGTSTGYGVLTIPNFISNVAEGTSPYACTSTTLNENLNADLLDGLHSDSFLRSDQDETTSYSLQVSSLYIGNSSTFLSKDISGNLVFTDINAGTITLSDLIDEIISGETVITNHSELNELDYASSGHTGFEASLGNPLVDDYILSSKIDGTRSWVVPTTSTVTSVFGRTGDVVATQDDYTWSQIDKTISDIADLTTKSHTSLDDIGTYTHSQIDSHIEDTGIHNTAKTPGSVIFAGSDGKFTEDNSNLFYDEANYQLRVGNGTFRVGDPWTGFMVSGNSPQWFEGSIQNTNGGQYATCMFSAYSDVTGATMDTCVMHGMGIASSTENHFYFPYLKPNDSYDVAFGGDLITATIWPTKKLIFATGGTDNDKIRMFIEDDKTTIFANQESESIPSFDPSNWDATNGFSSELFSDSTGQIVCVSDIDISTIEPIEVSGIAWVVSGTTYHIKMIISAASGSISYTIGGVTGTAITATTIEEYITATSTDNFRITAAAGATCTITSISVRALIADTGNLEVQGDIILGSSLSTTTGANIFSSNGEGILTFNSIPLLPASDPTSDNQAVRKAYVDTVVQGLYPVFNCRVATTTNGNLATAFEEGDTIDTVTLVAGDVILIKNQTTQTENGFYTVNASGAPTRVTGYGIGDTFLRGTYTSIEEGNINLRTSWVMYAPNATIGTDNILFRQYYVSQPYTASYGILLSGYDIQIDLANTNPALEILDGGLRVKVDDASLTRTSSGLNVSLSATYPCLEIMPVGDSEVGLRVKVDDSSISRTTSGLSVKALGITNGMLYGSIEDTKLSTISTTGKVSGSALTSLDSIPSEAGIIPIANLASGTPTGSKFIRDDGVLAVPDGDMSGTSGTVDSIVAGDNITVDDTDPSNPIVSSTYTSATPYAEVPTGTINGVNTDFTLAHIPTNEESVIIILDGVVQYYGVDFTISSGSTVSFITAPASGSTIFAYYNSTDTVAAQFAGLSKITVGITEPSNPSVGDIWIDTN